MKNLKTAFANVINNAATGKDKVIVWATFAVPMLIVLIAFGHNLK